MFLSKTSPRHLQDMSSRSLQDMSSRRLQDLSSRRLVRCFQDDFKTSSRRLGRQKIVTLKTCWRRLQDMCWRRLKDVLKTNKCLLGCFFKSFFFRVYKKGKIHTKLNHASKFTLMPNYSLVMYFMIWTLFYFHIFSSST